MPNPTHPVHTEETIEAKTLPHPRPERDTDEEPGEGLVALIRANPITAATLVASVLVGVAIGYAYIPAETYSPLRRIVGGGLAGGLSWLLVMVGRII